MASSVRPATPTDQPFPDSDRLGPEQLRTLFLFERLTLEQLEWLAARGQLREFQPGWVYQEGEPATWFYVLYDGLVSLTSRAGSDDVEYIRTDARGAFAGAFQAYLGDKPPRYTTSLRALVPTTFFVLSARDFSELMHEWFPMAVHLLQGLFYGTLGTRQAIGQREHLHALGVLAAGLAHELNNPAAAVSRVADSLSTTLTALQADLVAVAGASHVLDEFSGYLRLRGVAAARIVPLDADPSPLEAARVEDELIDWLDQHDVGDGWRIAPSLAAAGFDAEALEHGWFPPPGASLGRVLRWLAHAMDADLIAREIREAAARISTLVDAAKEYTQMDRAAHRVVDVHEGLDATLAVLEDRILSGIQVDRFYDRNLPTVPAYAGELNQVWTHLFDNALRAIGDNGTLSVRTGMLEGFVHVEVTDSGPGLTSAARDRLFEPFFTTRPIGEGAGLGLSIAWQVVVIRHHGDLRVESEPGRTCFHVLLPTASESHLAVPGAGSTVDGAAGRSTITTRS